MGSAWVVTSGTYRLQFIVNKLGARTARASVLTPSTMILASVLGLELVGRHSGLAIAMPGAVDERSSLACPSILGSVIHVWKLQEHD
jgi:hypothetical protein